MCYSNLNNHKRAFQTQSMHYHYYPLKEPPHFPSSGLSVLPLTHTFQGLAEVSISSLCSLNSFQARRSLQPYLRELAGFSRTLRAWDDTYHLWCWGFLGYSQSLKDWDIAQSGRLHNGWAIGRLSEALPLRFYWGMGHEVMFGDVVHYLHEHPRVADPITSMIHWSCCIYIISITTD